MEHVFENNAETISIKKLKITDHFIMLFSSIGGRESFVNMSPDDSAYDWRYAYSDRGDNAIYAKIVQTIDNKLSVNSSPKGVVEINPYLDMDSFLNPQWIRKQASTGEVFNASGFFRFAIMNSRGQLQIVRLFTEDDNIATMFDQ